ncbi:MAG: hypothetical protein JWP87_3124 [Labilithrix sp.]|nr:hypothetical protein [Labilithrix sp.]
MCRASWEAVEGRHVHGHAERRFPSEGEILSSTHLVIDEGDLSSSTHLLIDECIANVRETARLDDDAVLPPLPVVAPRRDVVILTKIDTAGSAASSPAASSTPDETAGDAVGAQPQKSRGLGAATHRVSRRSEPHRASRWALALCAVVAGSFASAAFFASPAGHKPSVVRVRDGARARASHAAQATAALFTR